MSPLPSLTALIALSLPVGAIACIQGKGLPMVRPPLPSMTLPPLTTPAKVEVALDPKGAAQPHTSEAAARETYLEIIKSHEARPANGVPAPADDTINYSASLIFVGRAADAIPVLTALEKAHPGLYSTAANLGTAYELTGDLPNALRWIRAGIERNSASHEGTEWLHVAILETKLKLQNDAAWLATHSVLDAAPAVSKADTFKAIEYQLNERLRFVRPRDAVVADLFYQAALRVEGPAAIARRALLLNESLRFDDLRATEIARLRKPS